MNYHNEIQVLLVEDNATDAEMTLRALRNSNFTNKIIHLEDGSQALDFVYGRGDYQNNKTNHKLNLILLDLKLPKVSGLEVLKILKSDPLKKYIPIVILTSSAEEKDIYESYNTGANSYIVKPVDFDSFFETIKKLGFYWTVVNTSPII